MKQNRNSQIIELMQQKNVISVHELAVSLGCTEMTVRRNLDKLAAQGFVQREHGYAMLLTPARSTDYFKEIEENLAEKKAIARAALAFIKPGLCICLDSGTTIQQLAEIIPDDLPLSVITPSLTAAMTLSDRKSVQVLMPGGLLHHSNRSLLFESAESLASYHADIAFISCRSLQYPGGSFEHSQTLTATKRSLASIAGRRILLADYSKWDISSICNCIPLKDLDLIITDSKAPSSSLEQMAAQGKEILVVDPLKDQIVCHYNKKENEQEL